MFEQDVKAGEKIKGIVAELKTFDDKGKVYQRKLVFQPYCEYYVPKWRDYFGSSEYTDPEDFVNKFGQDVLKRVMDGEIVEVKDSIEEPSTKKVCAVDKKFIKVAYPIIYPFKGNAESLVRESIYRKHHPEQSNPRALPTVDGYTVDERLGELRKVSFKDGEPSMEILSIDYGKGLMLYNKFLKQIK